MSIRRLLPFLVVGTALLRPAVARACSLDIGVPQAQPTASADPLPEGSFVIAEEAPVSADGTPWTEDAKLTELLARSRRELSPYAEDTFSKAKPYRAFRRVGTGKARFTSYVGTAYSYDYDIEIAGAAPPPPPKLDRLETTVRYTEGGSSGAGCFCPEVDTLTIRSNGIPEGTARPRYVAAWFGPTAEEAAASRDPDALFAPATKPNTVADFALGVAEDHERSGTGFGRSGRYCYALAWMDSLGRIGERSGAACLDTKDTNDPAVTLDDKGFCICGSVGASRGWTGGSVAVPFALVTIARRLMRRRRR